MKLHPRALVEIHLDKSPVEYTVWFEWIADAPLDRTRTYGISTGPDRKSARRLARAINDGAVCKKAKVVRDVNGQTYVDASYRVMGKNLDADLSRLGY